MTAIKSLLPGVVFLLPSLLFAQWSVEIIQGAELWACSPGRIAGVRTNGQGIGEFGLWQGKRRTFGQLLGSLPNTRFVDVDHLGTVGGEPDRIALFWQSDSHQPIVLNPPGSLNAWVHALASGVQVGWADRRACLWRGSAASFVCLHPQGAGQSRALGTDGRSQAGEARFETGVSQRAGWWRGSALSWTELHPVGANYSVAHDVNGDIQVGEAFLINTSNQVEAVLWRGSRESMIRLDPGFRGQAVAASRNFQLGTSSKGHFLGLQRPCLWAGTAGSQLFLDQFVPPGVSYGWTISPTDIYEIGNDVVIVGWASMSSLGFIWRFDRDWLISRMRK